LILISALLFLVLTLSGINHQILRQSKIPPGCPDQPYCDIDNDSHVFSFPRQRSIGGVEIFRT
jgi:hypothetical protein